MESSHKKITTDSGLRARMYEYGRRSDYQRRPVLESRSLVLDIRGPKSPQPIAVRRIKAKAQAPAVKVVKKFSAASSQSLETASHLFINDVKPVRKRRSSQPAHAVHGMFAQHAQAKAGSRQMPSQVLRREAVHPFVPRRARIRRLLGRAPNEKLLVLGGIVIVICGLGLGWNGFHTNQKVTKTVQTLEQQAGVVNGASTGDTPSENDPAPVSSYSAGPDLPRVIRINKLGVEARIVRLGIKRDNQLAAPGNIFDAGWYDGSSKPGEGGAMLIDGHVSGPTKHGVFYDLKKLVPGDVISVERGDGKIISYKVKKSTAYENSKVDMAAALVPVTPGKNGLNLITCDGDVDDTGAHFKQRLVVFAEQI